MTDPDSPLATAPRLGTPERVARQRELLTLDAFYDSHRTLWLRYATLQVGDRDQAARLVRAVRDQLAQDWEQVLRRQSVPEYAWAALKDHIHGWLAERGRLPVMADTAAFHAAVRKLLLPEHQDGFEVLERELGLYSAIGELTERQSDVVVLRYVLHAGDHDIAAYLGTTADAVRAHVAHAKARLALRLRTAPGEQP